MAAPSNSFVRESLATPRRSFLGGAGAAGVSLLAAGQQAQSEETTEETTSADTSTKDHRYKIGVCDWMILKRQRLGAFRWTDEIGADGVEVDMGSLGDRDTFESKLFDPVVRKEFLDEAKKYDVEICSIAMSGFFSQSLAERPTAPRMVQDCINTMVLMGVKISFLPLGVQGDLVKNPELRPAIHNHLVRRQPVGPQRRWQDEGDTFVDVR
jgi:L-ribulose-5-phosphate 3-epimerase